MSFDNQKSVKKWKCRECETRNDASCEHCSLCYRRRRRKSKKMQGAYTNLDLKGSDVIEHENILSTNKGTHKWFCHACTTRNEPHLQFCKMCCQPHAID